MDRKTLRVGCEAASGGGRKPAPFLVAPGDECMQRRTNYSRCARAWHCCLCATAMSWNSNDGCYGDPVQQSRDPIMHTDDVLSAPWKHLKRCVCRHQKSVAASFIDIDSRRCQSCGTSALAMANQQLWSVHPANPFNATAPFHAGMRAPALQRVREAWELFTERCVGSDLCMDAFRWSARVQHHA